MMFFAYKSVGLISAIISIIFGILIIKWKASLNYLVGIYFILIGLLGLLLVL